MWHFTVVLTKDISVPLSLIDVSEFIRCQKNFFLCQAVVSTHATLDNVFHSFRDVQCHTLKIHF